MHLKLNTYFQGNW